MYCVPFCIYLAYFTSLSRTSAVLPAWMDYLYLKCVRVASTSSRRRSFSTAQLMIYLRRSLAQTKPSRRTAYSMAPKYFYRSSLDNGVECPSQLSTTVTVTHMTVQSKTLRRVSSPVKEATPTNLLLALRMPGGSGVDLPSNEAPASPPLSLTSSLPQFATNLLEDRNLVQNPAAPDVSCYPLTLYDHRAEAPVLAVAGPDYETASLMRPNSMEGSGFELPDIAPFAQICLFACLGAGILWSLLVWLINSPSRPSNRPTQRKDVSE